MNGTIDVMPTDKQGKAVVSENSIELNVGMLIEVFGGAFYSDPGQYQVR